MKEFKVSIQTLLFLFILVSICTSCYKKFDPLSYAPPFTISGYSGASQIGASNLVGYWAFEGSYIDSVSNHLATGVGTSFVAGFKGQSLKGANNGYVIDDIQNTVKNLTSFTVCYWINTPQNTNGIVGTVNISRSDDFWGNLDMFYENGSSATSTVFKAHINNNTNGQWAVTTLSNPWNTWMHIALTYDQGSNTIRLYRNGAQIATNTIAGYGPIQFKNATKIVFGTVQFQTTPSLGTAGGKQDWASYLTGMMDEVRIYNKALTATELVALSILEGKGK